MKRHPVEIHEAFIDDLRSASRHLVRELGFMSTTLAGTALSPSAVHALIEIDLGRSCNANELTVALRLEKSTISRMLRRLVDSGDLSEHDDIDGRAKKLKLTRKGRETVKSIHAFARKQVIGALEHLPATWHGEVLKGISAYADALLAYRTGAGSLIDPVIVERSYQPGAVGRIIEMHARYYFRHSGFGRFFEAKVARELGEFCSRLDSDANGLWIARQGQTVVGSVIIDGEDNVPEAAHLRWFITDDSVRGSGIGRQLMSSAMAFCDKNSYDTVVLWTFKGLDAARHLYETFGFQLVEEVKAAQWGTKVLEQRFVRHANAGVS